MKAIHIVSCLWAGTAYVRIMDAVKKPGVSIIKGPLVYVAFWASLIVVFALVPSPLRCVPSYLLIIISWAASSSWLCGLCVFFFVVLATYKSACTYTCTMFVLEALSCNVVHTGGERKEKVYYFRFPSLRNYSGVINFSFLNNTLTRESCVFFLDLACLGPCRRLFATTPFCNAQSYNRHPGIVKSRIMALSCVWCSNLDAEFQEKVGVVDMCQSVPKAPEPLLLQPWPLAGNP